MGYLGNNNLAEDAVSESYFKLAKHFTKLSKQSEKNICSYMTMIIRSNPACKHSYSCSAYTFIAVGD